jgi:hypothetical protein
MAHYPGKKMAHYRNRPNTTVYCYLAFRENSLFGTTSNFGSLFDTEKVFIFYLTIGVNLFSYTTPPSILLLPAITFIFLRPHYPFLNHGKKSSELAK